MSLFKSLILFAFVLFPIVAVAEGDIREVTATGRAEVRVVPDEVVLSFAVETMNEDLNLAKQENDRIVKDAQAMSERLGSKIGNPVSIREGSSSLRPSAVNSSLRSLSEGEWTDGPLALGEMSIPAVATVTFELVD